MSRCERDDHARLPCTFPSRAVSSRPLEASSRAGNREPLVWTGPAEQGFLASSFGAKLSRGSGLLEPRSARLYTDAFSPFKEQSRDYASADRCFPFGKLSKCCATRGKEEGGPERRGQGQWIVLVMRVMRQPESVGADLERDKGVGWVRREPLLPATGAGGERLLIIYLKERAPPLRGRVKWLAGQKSEVEWLAETGQSFRNPFPD